MGIYKRKDSNFYQVEVYYKKPDGSFGRYYSLQPTRRAAIEKEAELTLKAKGDTLSPCEIKFSDLINEFISSSENDKRKTTIANYRKIFRLYLLPYFGKTRVSAITSRMVNDWKIWMNHYISTRYNRPLSISYRQKVYFTFKSIMDFGYHQHGLNNDSVNRAGNFEKDPNEITPDPVLHYWTIEQFRRFCDEAIHCIDNIDPLSRGYMVCCSSFVLITICFFAGLRRGEANALSVEDFHDGEHPYLHINKSLTEKIKETKFFITDPKSKASKRDVPIPDVLVNILRNHINTRLSRIDGFGPNMFLCGGVLPVADSSVNNFKKKIGTKVGIPLILIHDLRHSYASILINSGISVPVISKLMGHSSPEITYRIYCHMFPKTKNEAVEKVNEMINNQKITTF
jgi:integrase